MKVGGGGWKGMRRKNERIAIEQRREIVMGLSPRTRFLFFFSRSFLPFLFPFWKLAVVIECFQSPRVSSNQSNLFAKLVDSQMVIVAYSGKPKHPPPSNLIVQFRRFDGGIWRNFLRLEEIIISYLNYPFSFLV